MYEQSGVIPYRVRGNDLQIMLITSRGGKRWVIPKGIIESDMSAVDSAQKEAFEEAGVLGKVHGSVIGQYQYDKWGGTCTVQVFLLQVQEVLEEWPESGLRQRVWFNVDEAAALVKEKTLKKLIRQTPDLIKK